mmetsp:Transcript_27781/g.45671  ORF Transcript_27781/g.45671 Transcript_27781/m.45671 type:complete len:226 (+) Transcript_27781:130-807(+)
MINSLTRLFLVLAIFAAPAASFQLSRSSRAINSHLVLRSTLEPETGPSSSPPDEKKDSVNFMRSKPLTASEVPAETTLPKDFYNSVWKYKCKLTSLNPHVDYRMDLTLPIHLGTDGTITTLEDGKVILGASKWTISELGPDDRYINFYLKLDPRPFLPRGMFGFNARLKGNETDGFDLVDGIINSQITYDYYDAAKAIAGKLTGATHSTALRGVGTFKTEPYTLK